MWYEQELLSSFTRLARLYTIEYKRMSWFVYKLEWDKKQEKKYAHVEKGDFLG